MRAKVTAALISNFNKNISNISSVAVVGGSSHDPEVSALRAIEPDLIFHFFGIDNEFNDFNWTYLNLNSNNSLSRKNKFDLVISSQVLEHVWNIDSYFKNLVALVKSGGYIFINCPASNFVHGSPEYFSAGYAPEFLKNNLNAAGILVNDSGALGSRRYYFLSHVVRRWVKESELNHPIIRYEILGGSFLGELKRFFVELAPRIYSIFLSPKITSDLNYATESYAFGYKP
jgi:SAM-dependent methyltransferase